MRTTRAGMNTRNNILLIILNSRFGFFFFKICFEYFLFIVIIGEYNIIRGNIIRTP